MYGQVCILSRAHQHYKSCDIYEKNIRVFGKKEMNVEKNHIE